MGEGAEGTHWRVRHVGIDGRHMLARADVNGGSADVHGLNCWGESVRFSVYD